jgi:hypothetical protein
MTDGPAAQSSAYGHQLFGVFSGRGPGALGGYWLPYGAGGTA